MNNAIRPYLDRIISGDCLDVMPRLPGASIDLILCDLPYGVTDCAWDKRLPLDRLFAEYKRLLAPRGAIILTATQPFTTDLVNACRSWFRYDLVWDKSAPVGFLNANRMPLRRHESILVFYPRLPAYHPQFTAGRPYRYRAGGEKAAGVYKKTRVIGVNNPGRRYPTSILEFSRETNGNGARRLFHPTQKPVALFEWIVKSYTEPDAIVLDNCIGSGTTALACIPSGRHFIGIEKDPVFAAQAGERVVEARASLRSVA
ncbi:MAG TPA: site-specific DNA-methyltransferase [Spirochaetales bacterium]|nr:site-specific DNA-methyltransferase [Spirochaetales bacterium]